MSAGSPIPPRTVTVFVAFLFTAILCSATPSAVAAPPPNIVFILADDLGVGDVHCYGKERCRIETPHLDRLAREGVRMTDAYAPASVCVPTRVAIMTGRYAWRFERPRPDGAWGFLNPRFSGEQWTLGKMFRSAGYHTGYVGKWHLGTRMQTTDGKNQGIDNVDYGKPLKFGPVQAGFDDSFILPGSLDMYPYVFIRNNHFVGPVTARKGWSAFNRVGPAADDFEDTAVLDTFSREAERFLKAQAAAAQAESEERRPFFLYLALTAPHTPTSPSAAFEGRSSLGLYGDFVMETDHCVGRVLDSLDRLGLRDHTLVLAASDHGPALYAGRRRHATPNQLRQLERDGHHANGVHRGYKFSAYEGGLRVPLLARWPGTIPAGTTCDEIVGLNDLMATLSEAAGAQSKPSDSPDSISFLPLLKNPSGPGKRTDLVLQSVRAFVIRQGNWKLALCPGSGCPGAYGNRPAQDEAWRTAVARLGRRPRPTDLRRAPFVQLFHLGRDPGETTNLARNKPQQVERMIALLERHIATGRSTPGPRLANDRPRIDWLGGIPRWVR